MNLAKLFITEVKVLLIFVVITTGLCNYFGKSNHQCSTGIDINPVLIQKGCTRLAIFGLGAIKDERLYNMFEKGLVQCTRPSEDSDDWFNVFCIHQNRSAHGKKNYIPGEQSHIKESIGVFYRKTNYNSDFFIL